MLANCGVRPMTGDEVRKWFQPSPPDGPVCDGIASFISKMRGPSDQDAVPDPPPWTPAEVSHWRDINRAAEPAKLLRECMPALLRFWEGQQLDPKTRQSYEAIKKLEQALSAAIESIEWPLGRYERVNLVGKKPIQAWHAAAVIIYGRLAEVMPCSYRINSVAIRFIARALERLGHGKRTPAAISQYFKRHKEKFRKEGRPGFGDK